MSRFPSMLIALFIAVMVTGSARAQFFYSAPPLMMGETSFHIYSVPGVIDNGGFGSYFSCTNTTDSPIRVGVEVFGPPGGVANDPSATSLTVAAGGFVIFGTSTSASGIIIDSGPGAGGISKGAARILATAKKGIICGAFAADRLNAPPVPRST